MHARAIRREYRDTVVRTEGGVRMLHALLEPERGREPVEVPLGRFYGKLRITADKNCLFSTAREAVDGSAAEKGASLLFHVESIAERPGGKVSMGILLYEPLGPNAASFGRFKRD